MKKRIWIFLFCGAALVLVLVGRFLLAAEDSSAPLPQKAPLAATPSEQIPPSLKMSGVLKKIDLSDSNTPRLVVVGESGLEKTLRLAAETQISFEKAPLKVEALQEGDVLDIEYGVNETTGQVAARSVSVVVRSTPEPVSQNPAGSEDPEFEGMEKNDKKNPM